MNKATGRLRVDGFTLPEFYRPTLTVSVGIARPTASSDGGWVGVYAKTVVVEEVSPLHHHHRPYISHDHQKQL